LETVVLFIGKTGLSPAITGNKKHHRNDEYDSNAENKVCKYYLYLATEATLGKERETKVRWKKILRVIAKKKSLFFHSTPWG
jgi:hypothetical protein